MKPDPGDTALPLLTPGSNLGLGIRVPTDIRVLEQSVSPNTGGLSTFENYREIRSHYLPRALGGPDDSMQLFAIETANFDPDLLQRLTARTHYVVEPRVVMLFTRYEALIHNTLTEWNRHEPDR